MKTLKFLGTAGARFVMLKQLRFSAGMWLTWEDTNIFIDPGPGALLRCAKSKPKLDPATLDAIILTHCHLDHSSDTNVMIEAMTQGGFKKRGTVFAPEDALRDGIILKYLREFPEHIQMLKEGGRYTIGDAAFSTPVAHTHQVETYGLNFADRAPAYPVDKAAAYPVDKAAAYPVDKATAYPVDKATAYPADKAQPLLSLITDTQYFAGLEDNYPGKNLVINVVRSQQKEGLKHLSIADVERILSRSPAETAVLTHFGMTMLKADPRKVAASLEEKFHKKVIAAYDGMSFGF